MGDKKWKKTVIAMRQAVHHLATNERVNDC